MKKATILFALLLILTLCACTPPIPQDLSTNADSGLVADTTTQSGLTTDTGNQGGLITDPQPSNPQEPEEIDPSLEALDKALSKTINGYESLTTQHDLIIVKENGTLTLGAMLYKSAKNTTYTSELVNSLDGDFNGSITRKELRTLDDGALGLDTIYGESYYLPEGDGWRRYDGSFLEESIFSFIALGNLRLSIRDFTYDKETDLYKSTSIKGYSSISNLEIKLNDTHISHISYECGGTYPGAKKEYHTLTLYDINETKISGPTSELVDDYTEPLYYFEEEELATISRQTACFLAEYHYRNYLDKSPEDILSLRATCLSAGEYYTIYLSGAKDTPGPQDNAEEIDLTYKISPEGEILLLR